MNKCDYAAGDADTRPWGRWEVLGTGGGFIVKHISVDPGHVLSLQSHAHRSEHWIILTGDAEVTLDNAVVRRAADDVVFIPAGTKHRIANVGSTPLNFVEVQTGALLSESDIERFDDRYGRAG